MYRATPLYRAEQVKQGEVVAAKNVGIEMYQLMCSAGQCVFEHLIQRYGKQSKVLVLCGGGNNGGDGYVVAKLALESKIEVVVKALKEPSTLVGDAKQAYLDFVQAGGSVIDSDVVIEQFDVVVDALLGTGLNGEVRGEIAEQIMQVNASQVPVLAIDIPSGLCSNTGRALGQAIKATDTVSFIGIKQGLVTGQARRYSGTLHYAGLGVQLEFESQQEPSAYWDSPLLIEQLKSRDACAHKGSQGKALLIGGEQGLGGAILIAARACLKSGAGLTACLTSAENTFAGLVATPEVMFSTWQLTDVLQRLAWCDALALGPGLGQSEHAQQLLLTVIGITKPKVLDADALNLLSLQPNYDSQRIITPHPGEAARLLECSIMDVESNRYYAVERLQERYGGVVVLKGAGTLINDGKSTFVCGAGNSGMATGGMGDALTGVLVSLLAQGIELSLAARIGVMLHSYAADQNVEKYGLIGLTASDVIESLRSAIHSPVLVEQR
ncbi:bifunctional ADP-dependent (S)-NAD(P)H-hydrate dehydratase/NAD(P)H-hydrate epimerase [Vibrio panuliri]|uniref:Bifunctional NAD(P)H-hydrate repair enzyme n=1 Tax=Vibrio panuliri TaxID=1381081 RepID=A0A1Q9HRI6_9VIBR|nr:NAD(P)H-hydrate dehydratase [Vibrio panuliri]OLQ93445.1 bifunctional ADP-dependent (S)-NAD(P)H-hydrate dehydratase/NAD(P)H-hydrate epimerase [Vibrio panuliri]